MSIKRLISQGDKLVMKVVFRGNDTALLSAIIGISVSTAAGRVEALVRYKTEKTDKEKVSSLADPRKALTEESATSMVKELETLCKTPDVAVDKILMSEAWRNGHIQAELSVDQDQSAVALAELCWYWPHSQTPTDKQLQLRTNFSADEITAITTKPAYTEAVKSLMIKYRNPTEFKAWVKAYKNMPARFGTRMRLAESVVTDITNAVAKHHNVDLSEPKKTPKPEQATSESTQYDIVWGKYKEPDKTAHIVFGRTTIEAPTLNRAKTLATQEMNEWLESEIDEPDEKKKAALVDAQAEMNTAIDLHKGRWEDGKDKSIKFFGHHMNVWSGLFVRVKTA